MAAEANPKDNSQSITFSVNLISGLMAVLGVAALIFLVFSVVTNPVITGATDEPFGELFLAFLDSFGIVIPLLILGFSLFFFRLALDLRRREYRAAAWVRLTLFWLMVLAVVITLATLFDSISGTGAPAHALPVLILSIVGGVICGLAWYWLGENIDEAFAGGETIVSRESRLAWNLLIPTIAVLILVAARPLERTFIASLTNQQFAGTQEPQFVGLDNYANLLGFRFDALPCVTDESGECQVREVQREETEIQQIEIDGQAIRDVLASLSEGETVSGVPNLLNALNQPEAIEAAIEDETGETAAELAWYDGERLSTAFLINLLNYTLSDSGQTITAIESVGDGAVMAQVGVTVTETEVIYPNVRDQVGPAYSELSYSPVNTFNLFGQRIVFSARDDRFISAVGNTMFFTVVSVILELVLGMAIALTVNSKFPGRGLMRAAMLVPWAIPTVVSARLWEVMLRDNQSGVINHFLINIGLIDQPMAWLANSDLQIWSMIFVDVWKTTPFMALLLLAGLQTISSDIYEAANVDGANKFRQFVSITLPLLRPTIAVALVFRTLDAVRAFDVFDVLIGKQLQSMATYNQFILVENQQFGYASAVGVTIFVIILIFTIVYVRALGVDTQ